ncbi:ion transporter [Rufibacter sp. LB8]|uniref:ion transporter n=1 Tax=Rufibacter sp. LB8 TaxID=2777781 RepID=UPI001CEF6F50|nr:ion transporter [Rufibacter sp. LB8]
MRSRLRKHIYIIIHGTNTKAGRAFDVVLLWTIMASVLTVTLESVAELNNKYHDLFLVAEWFFTICFTIEYILRIYSHPRPLVYLFSFYGLIDLLSVLPTYLIWLVPGYHYLVTIRILRLLRVFRILKLTAYIHNAQMLKKALAASMHKILVFILTVCILVLIFGTIIYVVEGGQNGFTSIPKSIYWAIVTITTVGYGDITPSTALGQVISSVIMLMGYAIIAVPTGIVTVELSKTSLAHDASLQTKDNTCVNCGQAHVQAANFCSNCGTSLRT